jgi:hypothetical protein
MKLNHPAKAVETALRTVHSVVSGKENNGGTLPSLDDLLTDQRTLDIFREYFPNFKKLKKIFSGNHSKRLNIYQHKGIYLVKDFAAKEFSEDKALNAFQVIKEYHRCDNKEAHSILAAKMGYVPNVGKTAPKRQKTTPKRTIKPEPETELIQVDIKRWERAINDHHSNFHQFARSLGVTEEHLQKCNVGTELRGNTAFTVFGHKDKYGNLVNFKYFKYSTNGSRDKEIKPFYLKNPTGKKYGQCFYGEHLLREGVPVVVVESEKTAILASFFYPQFDFVATGGVNGLGKKLKALKGKSGYVLHDADEAGRTLATWKALKNKGLDFVPVELFPDKNCGYDLADALRDGLRPELTNKGFFRAMVAAGMNDTFGSDFIKKTTYESVIVDRYLSEFELPNYQYLILNSPTGTGKGVVYLRQKNKRILLVPYITLAKNLAASKDGVKAGAKAVYEGVQISPLDNVLIGTYETISKVIDQLDLSQYELWVDEAHNFIQSSSRMYREEALNLITNYFDKFGRVVLLSGTWIPTTLGPFSKFHFIHVTSKSKAPATINVIATKNRLKSVVKRIKENDGLHLVYIKGRTKCLNWAKTLSDLGYGKFIPINAETKLLQEQSDIIERGVLPEGVRGLVINDAAKEGVSLEDQAQYFVHFPFSTDSITTEQVLNRPRTFAPVVFCYVKAPTKTAAFHINPMTETERLTYTSNRLQREQELIKNATRQATWIENTRFYCLANDTFIPAQEAWDNDLKNKKFENLIMQNWQEYIGVDVPRSVDDEVRVNELIIANKAYQELCLEESQTPELYIANLISYGHNVIIQPKIEGGKDEELANRMEANVKAEEESEINEVYRLLAEFEELPLEQIRAISKKTKFRFKSELAKKWIILNRHLAETSEIVEVLKKNYKARQWNLYWNQLDFCLHLNGRMKARGRKKKQVDYFLEQIKTGDKEYTPDQLRDLVIKAQNEIYKGKSNEKMTTTSAVQTMKVFFQLENVRKADQRLYRIVKCGAIKEKLLPLKSDVTTCNTL